MISLSDNQPQLEEIVRKQQPADKAAQPAEQAPAQGKLALNGEEIIERPDVVNARVYRLRSSFVKRNVYITLGWIEEGERKRPIEIFFNSKDLTRSPEYAILTRLISALFRKSADASFILEELRGIHDPNGGFYKNGRFMHSFYAEVADVMEQFFHEVGILEPRLGEYALGTAADSSRTPNAGVNTVGEAPDPTINAEYKICSSCLERALVTENGCDKCLACGYSHCDK